MANVHHIYHIFLIDHIPFIYHIGHISLIDHIYYIDHIKKLFPVIFGVDRLGFPKFDGVQLASLVGQSRHQSLPNEHNKVLRSWLHSSRDELHVEIEVAMVEVVGDMRMDELAEFLHIHDKSGARIGPTFYRDVQIIIVAMPVFVGAFAKGFPVFLFRPFWHPKFVGGIESFDTCDINHCYWLIKVNDGRLNA